MLALMPKAIATLATKASCWRQACTNLRLEFCAVHGLGATHRFHFVRHGVHDLPRSHYLRDPGMIQDGFA